VQAPAVLAQNVVAAVKPDHPDHPETMDSPVKAEHPEAPDKLADHQFKHVNKLLHLHVIPAQPDHPDLMGHLDQEATTDSPDNPDRPETEDNPAHQDQPEMADHQDLQDSQELPEMPEPQEPADVELQDLRDHPDHQDQLDNPAAQDKAHPKDHPDHLAQPEHPDNLDNPAVTDSQADQEAQEFPAAMPPTAHAHLALAMLPLPPAEALPKVVGHKRADTNSALSRRPKHSISIDNQRAEPLFGVEDASISLLHQFPPLSMHFKTAVYAIMCLSLFGIQKI